MDNGWIDGDKRWFTREEEDVLEFTSGGTEAITRRQSLSRGQ